MFGYSEIGVCIANKCGSIHQILTFGEMCRLESQAAENVALKQRAEGYCKEAGALESRLALIKAQRNKLLVAFEGLAGLHRHSDCIRLLPHANAMSTVTPCLYSFAVSSLQQCQMPLSLPLLAGLQHCALSLISASAVSFA